MNWIVTLIIGGIVGWLASKVMKTDAQTGILGNIVIGIVGSVLGYWVAGALGFAAYGAITPGNSSPLSYCSAAFVVASR